MNKLMILKQLLKQERLTLLLLATLFFSSAANAEGFVSSPFGPGQAVHGGVGLIQVPTARFAEPGDFSMNYYDSEFYRFWSVSLTLFPWMESTVRYTDIRNRLYSSSPSFSGDQTLKDKGIDVKFRLAQEGRWIPQLALGFRDFGGTGFFESEFLTASKRFGDFDLHMGIGWGYLGRADNFNNPLCHISDSYCDRPYGYSGKGGKIDYQRFFKGPSSLYYGVEYQTPWRPLRLRLEKEGNDYSLDRAGVAIKQNSSWNAAINYNWGNFDFSANYQRGNSLGFGLSYIINFNKVRHPRVDAPPRPVPIEPLVQNEEEIDIERLTQALKEETGFTLQKLEMKPEEVKLTGYQIRYADQDEATERIGRLLSTEFPYSVKQFRLVETESGLPVLETVFDAPSFVHAAAKQTLEPDIAGSYEHIAPQPEENPAVLPEKRLNLGLETFWDHSFGAPESFYMYQMGLIGNASFAVTPRLSLGGTLKVPLLQNYNQFNFKVDGQKSAIPRVRTYVREYATRGDVMVNNLYAHWHDQLTENWYAQVYGGYLEMMFAGVGAEVLYRPVNSSIAIGVDINRVRQRSYKDEFTLLDYEVTTGHLNTYWEPSFIPDLLLSLSFGQFLAGDRGVQIDVAKRFNSGIITGAFAALTNVSAAEYGEGSFTKGFYLSIPFDLFTPKPSKGRGIFPWVPIARDGGQKLVRPTTLYGTTSLRSRFYE